MNDATHGIETAADFAINIRHASTKLTGQIAQTIVRQRLPQSIQATGRRTQQRVSLPLM